MVVVMNSPSATSPGAEILYARPSSRPRRTFTWPERFSFAKACLESGESVRVFAERHGLGHSTLTSWITRYRNDGVGSQTTAAADVSKPRPLAALQSNHGFVEIPLGGDSSSVGAAVPLCTLVLKTGARLTLDVGADFSQLGKLLSVLEAL